jgi:thiamine-phosphate pyrophosphorylase
MKLHALVEDLATARTAVEGGATVVQLRVKGATTEELVEHGRAFADVPATFIVNDDVEAAIELGADGVHLGQDDDGSERALAAGLQLGLSASTEEEAWEAVKAGASYVGAGPVWPTPSKPDAAAPIGLHGLETMRHLPVPVIAIGGVDAWNAADCIRAGASGVAVIRAVAEIGAVREAVDEALAAR